jgi:predicted RNA-binding Zn-ribbon protein involved in translation (DUF1610 family)
MTADLEPSPEEFNLTPDPRFLPVLGQITIDQWRCLAELIDNSIDGFLNASRLGAWDGEAQVIVDLPAADRPDAIVRVRDNGPGMDLVTLERAVRAGWSGNSPLENLGLFGVGFNIATARLGNVTTVWTTRPGDAEWHGLEIDFHRLSTQGNFRTPRLSRPKQDHEQSGTEVVVSKLKPEQSQWLAKGANQNAIRKRLSQVYAAMLVPEGVPVSFKMLVGNKLVKPRRHCVWDESRSITLPDLGTVSAIQSVDMRLAPRVHCASCLSWLPPETPESEPCPACGAKEGLRRTDRKIRGWLGVQRYLDTTEFGIDFIRNGRKIELGNKDLFLWRSLDGDEREYPIDDQRGRGRLIGEIHIDHVRVDYVKERFDRTDPAWGEMVEVLRGTGPLRPEKAKLLGYGDNSSPLFRLFKAFRRSSPASKVAGAYARLLLVSDNARAKEMAEEFHEGNPKFQDDSEWWRLVEEADRALLTGEAPKRPEETPSSPTPEPRGGPDLPDDLIPGQPGPEAPKTEPSKPEPIRIPVPSLTRKFVHKPSQTTWNVAAFSVEPDDPGLGGGEPWAFFIQDPSVRQFYFLFDATHPVFASITCTPTDALLTELAIKVSEFVRGSKEPLSVAQVLASLRAEYAEEVSLDGRRAATDALDLLGVIGGALMQSCPEAERRSLYEALEAEERRAVATGLASRRVIDPSSLSDGSFLLHPPFDHLPTLVRVFPEYCFDGSIWEVPYGTADFGDETVTQAARADVIERYCSLLGDAIWIAKTEGVTASREELVRAMMSLKLLRPDREIP